ncbi:S1C family serine protease [Pseudobacillus wudalianchiensis]|uniref:Peptidase S1 n=1 Tax=Pseudobacillus wudalianchiensis TaxID=1743143 RepID=A0A1B9B891_9BACI|nr:trypsin-like peptidase domain-containing protein [Bacillus wudalianchiensis]OCA92311.1 peptidase S1 [Bacillus wudalianchiensis]
MYEQELKKEKRQKKGRLQPLFTSFTGAIVGGATVLYLSPFLGANGELPTMDKGNAAVMQNNKADQSGLNVQQTAAAPNSMVNAISKINEAVVGVVNLQKQQTGFFQFDDPAQGGEQEAGTGSGVVFKKSGNHAFIVTNNHVVEGADKVEIALKNGKRAAAEIVGTDPLTDLAVLKTDSSIVTEVAAFGQSSKLQLGEQVAAIGNPLGLDLASSVTQGIVSGKDRTIPVSTSEGQWDLNVIQTDAAINPGNSGGALINSAGQVVGINSMKISESGIEGLGFAIPSEDVMPIMKDLLEDGKVKRPYLGVSLQDVGELPDTVLQSQLGLPANVKEGVVIAAVETASPAVSAGLQAKDVIQSVNGTKVSNTSEFRKYLYSKAEIGEKVEIGLYRNGKQMSVTLKLSEK